MNMHYDVIVIGAGPAGMSASVTLAEVGLGVLVLDEQSRVGGQIYRSIETCTQANKAAYSDYYDQGSALVNKFHKCGAQYKANAMVWQIEPEGRLFYTKNGQSHQVSANYIIVATGAMERQMPIPGWNLPGVMGVGAVSNLAKEGGLTPAKNVVIAGSGPLLLLEASLLAKKGVKIQAIFETTPSIPSAGVFPHIPKALKRTDFLMKGMAMIKDIKKAKIPHFKGVKNIRALGNESVESVTAETSHKTILLEADLLLIHFGVIPNTHIFRMMGCRMTWNQRQRYWHPLCDEWGRTNYERIFAAGDGVKVSGGLAAEYKGKLAALEIGHRLGILPVYERDMLAEPIKAALYHDSLPRPFIDELYAPKPNSFQFDNQTIVCRCEHITVEKVRKAIKEGVQDVNEIKIMTRCGMGNCQGRMCGSSLAEIVAAESDIDPAQAGLLAIRPPLKPIPLQEIAELEIDMGLSEPANLFKNQSK